MKTKVDEYVWAIEEWHLRIKGEVHGGLLKNFVELMREFWVYMLQHQEHFVQNSVVSIYPKIGQFSWIWEGLKDGHLTESQVSWGDFYRAFRIEIDEYLRLNGKENRISAVKRYVDVLEMLTPLPFE